MAANSLIQIWSVIYIRFFPQRNIKTALALAGALWLVILALFFPIVGWGFAGLHISPKLIPASFMPHLLFGMLLWGLDKYIPRQSACSITGDCGCKNKKSA